MSTPTKASTASTSTVTFDIGGTNFTVATSTIEQHPESMLATMISGRWAIEGSEVDQSFDVINEKPLFIDRNPNRFGFVLDFLRDGKVNLPHTTTAEEMAIDFDYLNIDVPEEAIAFHPLPAPLVVSNLVSRFKDLEDKVKESGISYCSALATHAATRVAHLILKQHYVELAEAIREGKTGTITYKIHDLLKVRKESQDAELIRLNDAVRKDGFSKHVEETLESFGIRSTISSGYYSSCYSLTIKLI